MNFTYICFHILFGKIWFLSEHILHSCNTYTAIHIYMRKHSQHNNDEQTRFFRKIYLSPYSKGLRKGYVWEVSWRLNKTATYWLLALLAIAALLSHYAGLFKRGGVTEGCKPSVWELVLSTASYLQLQQLTPNSKLTRTSVTPGYINVWRPPASVSVASAPNSTRPQSRLSPDIFDRMHLLFTQVHFLFDSSGMSEVNMLHTLIYIYIYIYIYSWTKV